MPSQRLELRIKKLCQRLLQADEHEFRSLVQELRAALHEHNHLLRKLAADKLSRALHPPKSNGSVTIAKLGNRRNGKHLDLTAGILRELKMLKQGLALQIPLANMRGVELANLRSAVHRAAAADNLEIQTRADEMNFYVWLRQAANRSEKNLT